MRSLPLIISLLALLFLFVFPLPLKASDNELPSELVDALYAMDRESLDQKQVVSLSKIIIKDRHLYNNNTLAKLFSLLADVAMDRGDVDRAMQFAKDGRFLVGVEQSIISALSITSVAGHYYKGQFQRAKIEVEQVIEQAIALKNDALLIEALCYRAVANGLVAEHQQALGDIHQVEELLGQHQEFSNHLTVLNVFANAHFYLGDHETAITLNNKILALRFELNKKNNLEQTYYNLARSYLAINQLDDAYNAYWQAYNIAEAKGANIKLAYALLGLAQVGFQQQEYQKSVKLFNEAEQRFKGQNLTQPYVTTLLYLAKVQNILGQAELAEQYIEQAYSHAQNIELTEEQIEIYLLMSELFNKRRQYQKAFTTHQKYLERFQQFAHHQHKNIADSEKRLSSNKRRDFSLQYAEQSSISNRFKKKYTDQKNINLVISSILLLSFLLIISLGIRLRTTRLNQAYEEVEKPLDYIASSSQTKKFYQQHFKMARRFDYPLAVGYFSIDNWQELKFQFSKKIVQEVMTSIATLINEYKGEFDQVGLINEGEYLFLSPHQDPQTLQQIFQQISESLKVQFFANLGEFSMKFSYDCQSPNVQDIDPYIFLSRLSESTRAEYSPYKK